ncbi:MAG: hypothetical protein PHQ23_15395, partial [Candidatus Wallbacteria bacterium]|nr:hypothetical protein [Candidatus Wallbacteria bacterium]
MKFGMMMLVLVLAGLMTNPVFASINSFAGVAQVTVCADKNLASMPEVTVQQSTDKLYSTQEEADQAARKLLKSATDMAVKQARETWQVQVSSNQIKITEKNTFVRTVQTTSERAEIFYRGIVAQGFMFQYNGESKVVFHSSVTSAFTSYDEAWNAARAMAKSNMDSAKAKISSDFGVPVDQIEMVAVNFDVDITDRDDENYVPQFRGMVVHGFSFEVNGEKKYVQKAGITEVFDNYNDAWHASRAMAKTNFENGKAAVAAEYSVQVE